MAGALMPGRGRKGRAVLSLQRLLSKTDKFATLFQASAEEAHQAGKALSELLENSQNGHTLDEFILRRREEKRINREITALLCSTFVTPLEREDLEALSRALYRIPKTLEKFAERMLVSQNYLRTDFFAQQAALLEQSIDTVREMVRQVWHRPRLEKINEENDRLHHLEGEADKLMLEMIRDLYSGQYEPLQVIVLRDLCELLEKVIDRCRDAGNVIFQIVLKNS